MDIKNRKRLRLYLIFYCLLLAASNNLFAQLQDAASYTVAGTYTWTVPACVTSIQVEAFGGGGGGGGVANSGGGGGGSYAKSVIAVTPGQVFTITVGAGGAGGNNATGSTGGTSTFTMGGTTYVLAVGGSGGSAGGAGGQGGLASSNTGNTLIWNGGTGGTGNGFNGAFGGGGGSSAGRSGNGNSGKSQNGEGCWEEAPPGGAAPGGGATGGAGGYSSCESNTAPTNGSPGGGGGGGQYQNGTGGTGGAGAVNINWGQYNIYNATTTWTAPAGITSVVVQAWGAGGGGYGQGTGAGGGDSQGGGGGGGGGAYAESILPVTPGTTYTIHIGTGGARGESGPGGNGGSTWFGTAATILAAGGQGGQTGSAGGGNAVGGQGGQSAASIGNIVTYNGGNGGGANSNNWGRGGGGGSSAGTASNGNNGASGNGGNGNPAAQGGAAPAGGSPGANGGQDWGFPWDANDFGGGGAGSAEVTEGGFGANGQIIIGYQPSISISNNPPVIAPAQFCPGVLNIPIHSFVLTGQNELHCPPNLVTDVSFVTTGTYLASDITDFKLYYTTTNSFSTANLLSTIVAPAASGTQTFPPFVDSLHNNTIYYWIAMDLTNTSGGNRTLAVNATTPANMTSSPTVSVNPAGYGAASGTQTLLSNPTLSSTLTPPAICSASNFNYTATSATAGATFTWSRATIAGITQTGDSGTGNVNEVLTNTTTASINVTYVYTTMASGCSSTQNVVVTVNPIPNLSSTLNSPAICSGTIFTYTPTSATAGAAFTWNRATIAGITQPGDSGTGNVNETLTNTSTAIINVTYAYTTKANGCSSTQNIVVPINPPPILNSTLNPPAICSGTTFNYTATSATAGATFTWNRATIAGITQPGDSGTGNVNETLTNTTTATINVTYVYITSANGCTGPAQNIIVPVNPNPILNSTLTPPAICSGNTFTYTATSATAGATFTWNRATIAGITQAGDSGTGNVNQTLTNATHATINVTYVYVTSANGCTGPAQNIVVPVNALPTGTVTGTVTKCLNDPSPAILFSGGTTTPPYTFTYSINGGTNQTVSTTGGNSTVSVAAPTNVAGGYTYSLISVKDGTAQACLQTQTGSAVVTVNPLGATIAGTTSICQNAADPVLTFTGTGGTAPYIFTYNINGGTNQTVSTTGGASSITIAALTGTTGNFSYNLSSVQDASSITCLSVSSATVTVNILPTTTMAGTTTVCLNSALPNIVFTGASTSAPYKFTYFINGGGNQTVSSAVGSSTVAVPVLTSSVGVYTYSLVSVQDGTAQACSQAQNGGAVVTVRQPSTATVTASSARVCQNASSPNMVFSGSVGQPPYIFYYSTNVPIGGVTTHSVSSAPGSTVAVAVPTGAPDTIVFTVTNVQDASGIVCGIGGSTDSVIVDPLPISTITAALNDVCLGNPPQTITFTGFGVPAPVTFDYYISTNGGPNVAQTPISSIAPSLTTTISAPANTLGTTVYTNGISSSNVCAGGPGNGSARLTVHPIPTATIGLTSAATICQSATGQVTFSASVGTAPFIFSYNINGGATQTISTGSGKSSVNLPVNHLPGTYTYSLLAVSDTFNCNQPQGGAVSIVVDSLPLAVAGGNSGICMNGAVTVSGTNARYGSVLWSSNGTGTLGNATTLTPTYTAGAGDAGKSIMLTMVVTATDGCNPQTASATYIVNVDSLPLAVAGGNQLICQNGTTAVSGDIARYGSILWTDNGAGTLSNATTLTPSYTAAAGDAKKAITLTMTVTSTNSCAPQTATAIYTVNVDSLPLAVAGGNQTICQNAAATVNGANVRYGSIVWSDNGTGTLTNTTTLTPTYTATTGDAGNTVTLTMTVTATNTCAPQTTTATYTIKVDPLPTATAGGHQTICQNATATVAGASLTNGTPAWVSNGAGTLTNAATLTPTYTAAAADAGNAVVLTMTVTSTNTCNPRTATATYTVNVDPLPTATAGGNQTICENGAAVIAGISLTNGEPSWVSNGGGTLTNATTLTPTYTAAAGDAKKAVTLTMTVTSTNSCNPQTALATYTVNVDSLPLAVAGGNQTICENAIATVNGANSRYGTILWTDNGAGTLANATTLTPTYTAAPADAKKAIILTMNVTSTNSCAAQKTTATYTVNVDSLPLAVAGGNQTICENAAAIINATNARYGTVLWTDNGAGTLTNATTLTPTYMAVGGDAKKAVILTMTVTSTNSCAAQTATATYTVNIDSLPLATAGGSQIICENATATVNGANVRYGSILWTTNGAGTVTNATTLTPTYTAGASDAKKAIILTMAATATNTCKPQTTQATYTVNVDSLPLAIAGGNQTICQDGTATVGGTNARYGSIAWTDNGAGSITVGANTLTPTYTAAAGDVGHPVTLTMTVTSTNTCATQTTQATYTVNVDPLPVATTAITNTTICANGVTTISGATSANGTILWTDNGAGAITAGATSLTPTYTPALGDAGNTVTLTMTVKSNNTCNPQTATADYSIMVNPLPTGTVMGTGVVCQGEADPMITFTGAGATAPYSFVYTINGGAQQTVSAMAGNSSATVPVPTTTGGVNFNYTLVSVTDGSATACFNKVNGPSATMVVNKTPQATIGSSATICMNATQPVIAFNGSGGTAPYTFIYSINGATQPNLLSNNNNQATVVQSTATANTFIYQLDSVEYTSGGRTCAGVVNQTVTIKVNPLPTATIGGGGQVCVNGVAPVVVFTGANTVPPYSFTFTVNNGASASLLSGANGIANLPSSATNMGTFTYSLVSVTDAINCSQNQTGTAVVSIEENPLAIFTITPDTPSTLNPIVTIIDNSTASSWLWDFGDGSVSATQNPAQHTYPSTPASYIIKLLVANGNCYDSTTQVVNVQAPVLLYIPNTFTPNGDSKNDVFMPKGDNMTNYSMYMYDRWGNMIFYSDDINKGWDGRANGGNQIAQEDAYVYIITTTDLQGHDHIYRGVVTLIK